MKATYKVLMRFKFPAWDEVEGIEYQVTAKNKAEAVKRARRQADDDGHMGVRYFTATEQNQQGEGK